MSLGKRIVELRKLNGDISRNKLATDLGISQSNLRGYELDENTPSAIVVLNIANYFGVTTDWLLTGKKNIEIKKAEIITDPDLEFAIQLLTDLYTSQGPDMRGWAKITFNEAFESQIAKKKKDSTSGIA